MDSHIFVSVLLAAAMHAGWNAILKLNLEPLRAITLVSIAAGVPAIVLLPFVPVPHPDAWFYLFASLAIHLGYYLALGEAYRTGDLGQVYPIARGAAPLMTAAGTTLILGERLGTAAWAGIVILAAGVVMLSLRGGRDNGRFETRAVTFALLTALTITAYTLVDGIGGRKTPVVLSYIVWLFFIDGVMMLVYGLWRWPKTILSDFKAHWSMLVAGGCMSAGAYAIAIWAMTKAPIALVAALRETSVLFAALIGMVLLREPLIPMRIAAAVVVMVGALLLRLG